MRILPYAVSIIAALSLSVGVAIAGSEDANPSDSGAAHGAFADQYGNFGFLGELGDTPGFHGGATGQEPDATGANNCSVQGNCPASQ